MTLQKIKFTIDQKDFFCDASLVQSNQFTVQSIPKNYRVFYEKNAEPFEKISTLLKKNENNVLMIDSNLVDMYKPILDINPKKILIAAASENFKTLDGAIKVLDFLQKNEFTKGEQLVVVGGGIIQDVAAFAGAMYKRGISRIHFPTTLLSMCDSCIGGKTGINYHGAKNQLALFSSPSEVYIYPHFLKTLTEHEINSGLGEILKLCMIGGDYFMRLYNEHVYHGKVKLFSSFKTLIMAALCVKKSVIEADEFELNHRRSMNYGHTLGHAIEILSDYKIPHGQAVVVGMVLANELSYAQGLLSKQDLILLNQVCLDLINESVLSYLKNIKLDTIVSLVQKDKKTVGQYIHFVMLKSPGEVCFVKCELNEKLFSDIESALVKFTLRQR